MIWKHAITWANVDPDLCHYMASLDHNELNYLHHINYDMKMQTYLFSCFHKEIQHDKSESW